MDDRRVVRLIIGMGLAALFSLGYLVGIWSARDAAQAAALEDIRSFSQQVSKLQGAVSTMESVCR